MIFTPRQWLFACAMACGTVATPTPAAEPIPPSQFNRLHALIKPQPAEEKWQQIPWLSSLWEARRRAAAQGKPILLWEMDGHPLGCT
jgi:hypothetical protein